ncbi:hypothetical protein [Peribacillus loiseleuriae]|uniref:hypothetical protein n=1 Tax=Peribacillus loiseleuriae TaxID=1679170 RepID=UPI003D01C034
MSKSKKKIETYDQLRKRIGSQINPKFSERKLMQHVLNEEYENGETMWVLTLVYLLGKLKGSGVVTFEDLDKIVDKMQEEEKKIASTTVNSEGNKLSTK